MHQLLLLIAALIFLARPLLARMPTTVTAEGERDHWELLFLYENNTGPGQRERIFRPILPLYGDYRNEERAYYRKFFLFPILYVHGTDDWRRWNFLHIFSGDSKSRKEAGSESDFFFPFLFWGRGDTEKERYFGLFPIYGKYKNKFSWSEIRFFLFPLYSDWSYRDYRARSILWPLIMWGGSETRHDLRLFPIYSSKVHDGKYKKRTFLWPFFQWGHLDLDKREPRHYLLFWPLYGYKWSDRGTMSAHMFLWPFFSWGRDTVAKSFNLKLFLLYQYGYSENPRIKKHMLIPLFAHYRFGTKDESYYREMRQYLLYVNLNTRSEELEARYHVLIPFWWHLRREYKREKEAWRYVKLWPLFSYTSDTNGNRHFQTLSLWPLYSEDVDRIWGPLWNLYEYQRYENGDRYHSALLRAFSTYSGESKKRVFLLGFDYYKSKNTLSFQFLGGLFGYKSKRVEPPEGREMELKRASADRGKDSGVSDRGEGADTPTLKRERTIRLLWFDI